MSFWWRVTALFTTYNIPGYGILLVMLVTLIKTWPIIQKNLLDARENRESRYGQRIRQLEEAVEQCHRDCETQAQVFRLETRALENTLAGLRRQHIQEQISLIAAIVESVDNPLLKQLLASLQSVQRSFPVEQLGEVLGDAARMPKLDV